MVWSSFLIRKSEQFDMPLRCMSVPLRIFTTSKCYQDRILTREWSFGDFFLALTEQEEFETGETVSSLVS